MAEPRGVGRLSWRVIVLLAVGVIVIGAYAALAAIVLPGWIVSLSPGANVDPSTRFKAIVDTRAALLGALAPALAAIGAVAALLQTSGQNRRAVELSRETLDVTRRGQLTERFTKAIDQLGQTGDLQLDIRLGGIYALEQIAKESKELHGPVMEILTAFLREHSRPDTVVLMSTEPTSNGQAPPLRADFQAIATVLGRRQVSYDPAGFRVDLRGADLHRANFAGAQLQGALFGEAIIPFAALQNVSFTGAQLQEASFVGAELQNASFAGAKLQKADFASAKLQGADFYLAQLQNASFAGAQLQKAEFTGVQLQNASFRGAQLQGAFFFNGAQLQGTDFIGAQLQNASFRGAHLERAWFALEPGVLLIGQSVPYALDLTWEQLSEAADVDKAILPDYLTKVRESRPDVRPTK